MARQGRATSSSLSIIAVLEDIQHAEDLAHTGCASGIGRSTAELVLARGDNLVATARDVSRILDLARRYAKQAVLIELNVTDMSASRGAVETAMEQFGRLDVLLNNAGYAHLSPFEQIGYSA